MVSSPSARLRTFALLTSLSAGALSVGGCGSMFFRSRSQATTGSSNSGYAGPVTFENRTQSRICRLEASVSRATFLSLDVSLGAGESATLDTTGTIAQLWVTECGGNRVLFGRAPERGGTAPNLRGPLSQSRVVLYAPGEAPGSASDHVAIEATPVSVSDWYETFVRAMVPSAQLDLNDPSEARETFAAIQQAAASRRWPETLLAFEMIQSEWSLLRHRATGRVTGRNIAGMLMTRFPDGHCQGHTAAAQQDAVGDEFQDTRRFYGTGPNYPVPCAVAEYAATRPGAVH